ncbi:MAG: TIGR02099 family protein, partial [Zoogloeaceae bacterium]|nr:TIGR02099 family protein [Zoogloeaceae bacterium]
KDVRIFSGRAEAPQEIAIQAASIEGLLAWRSFLFGQPIFASLTLHHPELTLARKSDGRWQVAGLNPSTESGEGNPMQWVLEQQRIRVIGARFHVRDELAKAPGFSLVDVELDWRNRGARHRFGLTAHAIDSREGKTIATIDVRGDLRGEAEMPVPDWQGRLYIQWQADALTPWRGWWLAGKSWNLPPGISFDLGKSDARIWIERIGERDWQATAESNLHGVRLRLHESLPELRLLKAEGRLSLSRDATGKWQAASKGLRLVEEDQQTSAPLDVTASWQEIAAMPDTTDATDAEDTTDAADVADAANTAQEDVPRQVDFTANRLDLTYLTRLSTYFPLSDTARQTLLARNPQGVLERVRVSWEIQKTALHYTLEADFSRLGMQPVGIMPGASGLSGHVRADENGGQARLDSRDLSVSLPAVFAESVFPLTRLQADVDWQKKPDTGGVEVQIRQLDFFGAHFLGGKVSGSYESRPGERGLIDLSGDFTQVSVAEVWRYIPKIVSPNVAQWLRGALKAGVADAQLTLRGNLQQFPFPDDHPENIFKVDVQARDATVRYAPDWPEIQAFRGDLAFGAGMRIQAKEGRIFSLRISDKTTVSIPNFSVPGNHLLVDGEVEGKLPDFLRFMEQSPVADFTGRVTVPMKGEGEGRLELKLDLPLRDMASNQVEGRFHLLANRVHFMPELPPARSVRGTLAFSRGRVATDAIEGDFLGKPFKLTIQSGKDTILVKANGGLDAAAVKQEWAERDDFPVALLERLSGETNLQLEINVRGGASDIQVRSTLEGLASTLPEPFNKEAAERLRLRISKRNQRSQGNDELTVRLGGRERRRLDSLFHLQNGTVARGVVAMGMPLHLPEKGVQVLLRQKRLDVDFWQSLLERKDEQTEARKKQGAGWPFPDMVSLDVQELRLWGRDFAEVNLRLFPQEKGTWRAELATKEIVGNLRWDSEGNRVTADLRRAWLTEKILANLAPEGEEATGQAMPDAPQKMPELDIRIDDFAIGKRNLGKVSVLAENENQIWYLRNILIENPDGRLTGSGVWHPAPINRSHLDFKLSSENSGRLLGRLGYPNMMRRGNAELSGELDWQGRPVQFNAKTLSGKLKVDATNGQFSRIEPGAGKLLGLLSLQSLTRRLTLDFRDIFSDGYAFDSLAARLSIQAGVISTDKDLRVVGPAGEILMSGTTDMNLETQNLVLIMQPELGGVAAVGVATVINPLVGAAALLAQRILRNPLNRVFRIRYHVTGSWDNPVMERQTRLPKPGSADGEGEEDDDDDDGNVPTMPLQEAP